jgi:hypothetical protein
MSRLRDKALQRQERIGRKAARHNVQMLKRGPDMPKADVPRLRIGGLSVKTRNRQVIDERGKSTRTPPRRTPR